MPNPTPKPPRPRRPSCIGLLIDLLIDFSLMGMGVVLYYHFMVYSLGPVGLSPVFVKMVGGQTIAVLLISGIPFVVGVLALLRSIFRFLRGRPAR